jgi:hypothetical protein
VSDQQDHYYDSDAEQQGEQQPTGSGAAPSTAGRDISAVRGVMGASVVSATAEMSTAMTHDEAPSGRVCSDSIATDDAGYLGVR